MALIGRVVAMTGVAYLITDNGTKRELHLGDEVQIGDTIQTAGGVEVDMELVTGRVVHIGGDQLVKFTEELSGVIVPTGDDSAINQATIDTVIKAIEDGKDINEVLDETSAGINGQSNSYGFNFVDLLRINEVLNLFNFQYQYDPNNLNNSNSGISDDENLGFIAPAGGIAIVNSAPTAVTDSIGSLEGNPPVVNRQLLATDPDGDPLTYSVVGTPPAGFILTSDGKYSFDYNHSAYDHLATGVSEVINVTYRVADGKGGIDTSVITITVTGTNDAPIASVASATGAEDATSIAVTLSGSDIDGTIASVTLSTLPANGTLYTDAGLTTLATTGTAYLGNSATLYFVPNANYNGTTTFTYTVTDDQGASDATPATATISVTAVNDAPTANPDTLAATEDTAVTYTAAQLLGNDTDPENQTLTIASVTSGANGTAVLNPDGTVTFTPNANFNGTAGFSYTTTDGTLTSTPATVTVNVAAVNDAPIASVASATGAEDATSIAVTLSGSDIDGTIASVTLSTLPANGTLYTDAGLTTLATTGTAYLGNSATLYFVPNANYNGTTTFTYTVTDDQGASDATPATATISVTAVNDAALLSSATVALTEGNTAAAISTGGTLTISDVDSPATFVAQTGTVGTYGTFAIDAAGVWTYTASSAHNEFAAGSTYTDSFSVASADGTTTNVTVNIAGTNDAALLSSATVALTEGNTAAAISTGGTLTISDVDSPATFVAQTGTVGTYGTFAIDAAGVWTYTASSAHNEFAAGSTYTDSFSVASADGTTTNVTVNIAGTNDAALLSSATVALTEGNTAAAISTGGTLTISDVDSPATFVAQTGTVGTYGTFAIDAAGVWTYTASSAHNEFAAGSTYTDSFSVASADGTTTNVTVNIAGTNDAALLSSATVALTEGNTAAAISTGGTLTISDVDSPATFVAQTGTVGTYGTFAIDAAGVWTYTASSAHNEFAAGSTYTDSFSVASADGTTTNVTVNIAGTNDAALLSSATVALTEGNTAAAISTGGTLTISDVDSPATFVAQTGTVGTYGTFAIDAAGVWTYTASSAHNEFAAGSTYTDSFSVASADGTTTNVTVNIAGTNDAALLSSATVALTEGNTAAAISTGGTLTISDVDSPATFVAQTGTVGTYGTFAIDAAGVWTYTASSAHNEFAAGSTYTDSFSVASADGTTTNVTVNIAGTNDAALLSSATVALTEGNTAAAISTGGTLTISDVDSPATFVAQTGTVGTYGTFAIDAAGVWTYTASSAHNEFAAGSTYTDSFSVASADGTTTNVTVNIAGTNDAALLSSATVALTEGNTAAAISTGGTLTISDVDSPATFVAQTGTVGTYGTFAIDAAGVWTYTASSAHNEFAAGSTYTDSFSVASADGTTTNVTVNIAGTNDAALLSSATVALTEGNTAAAISTGGTLTISDVDSPATFVAQTGTVGTYGTFAIDAAGVWTYTASSAHNEFAAGSTYTDSFSVASADGTTTNVTVNIAGTNDAALLSSATVALTEGNTAAAISTGGTLTISDVDSPATFVAQTGTVGTYGTFAIDAAGVWTYTASSAHNEFAAGSTYTDSFSVASADGTTTNVTVNIAGTNDAALLSSATVALTEGNTAAAISTGGTLTISDVDSPATFVAQTGTVGTYGTFAIDAAGVWTYTASSAHNEFAAGSTYTDSFSVASADGTTTNVTVNIAGTNDAALLSSATVALTEGNTAAAISTGGTLTISDVDSPATFVAQTGTVGTYGTFAIDAAGVWTYTASSAHNEFAAGSTYTDSFSVASADGTTTNVTVNIAGTNDAALLSSATVALTEGNTAAAISTGGTLTISDVDSPATFVAQTGTVGTYGTFAIDAAGVWTYTASSAHNEFAAGSTYTDSFSVASADGTTTNVTVNIAGTNDAALLSSATVALTEGNTAAAISTGGTLTISDVDSPATFVAQTGTVGTYGTFAIDAAGVWTYTASSAHNEFAAGSTYTDSFSVASADGTTTNVTVNIAGTNDAALLSSATVALTEGNTAAAISTGGTLTISDVDSPATFVAQTGTVGTYGTFAIDAAGVWTYTASSAHNEFAAGSTYTDSFSVASADGTTTNVTVNIAGTNDAALLSSATVALTEGNTAAAISTGGTLTISDVDSPATFVAQTGTVGTYGTFAIDAAGVWTYTASSAHNEFAAGSTYTDSFSVASADGTTTNVTVNIAGTNDAALLSSATVALTEGNTAAAISTGGTLTISDVDSPATFVAQTGTVGTYGTFAIDAAGVWTYTASSAHNEFAAGSTYTDSFSVASADGTTTNVTVNIAGTNDAALLSSATVALTEGNTAAAISTGGTLTISDVDSPATFVAQTGTVGTYGTFAIDAAGVWTYTASSAHNEFAAGSTYTDSFSVASADGTTTNVTVNIAGTNDAALLSSATVALTEGNTAAAISTGGTLTISDVDSPATFVAQTGTVGTYGTFAIDAAGVWTYTASSAHNEFAAGSTYTDSFSVASADGTTTNVTVNIAGTNDAALLSSATVALTEGNTAAAISTGGTLTISDVDSPATFVAQTGTVGTYGTFAIDAAGVWTYTASSAHNEFAAGSTYTDSFSVASADGTTTNVTVNIAGTNDAALLSSATVALTEGNTAAAISTGGTLTISDVDSPATFVAQTGTVGTYGTFAIDAAGVWTYTASSAHNEFAAGSTYTDSFSVASADGTTTNVTVNIAGTNDAALLSSATVALTEGNTAAAISTGGTLTISDVDSPATFVAQTGTVGTYGTFAIDAAGVWTYTASSAHNEFAAGSTYTDSFSVASADGTTTNVTVNIAGTNDAALLSSATVALTEGNTAAAISTGGTLTISDVDSPATFVAQTGTVGTYGTFAIDAAGVWTYTASSAHNEFAAGSTYTDSFSVASADGTTTNVTVNIAGTNDAALLSSATVALTEGNTAAAISTGGTLTISDVDSPATFVAQTGTVGTYGTFAIDAAGVWTYTASSAHNEFAAGSTYTDSFSVASADGTTTNVTVNIAGTNDAALLSSATVALTEGNTAAAISTGGTLTISDVDSPATFVAQTGTVGTYGTFAIDAAGVWTYTASSAHNEFAAGSTYTDSFSVASADGTTTNVTVNIAGTNDAALLSSATVALTEGNTAAAISTGGTLTISDVDSPATFVAQTGTVGTYGTFAIDAAGVWTYTASSAHNEFAAGSTYTDSFSVASADGTTTNVTVNIAGTNDAALLSSATVALTEGNTAAAISTGGTLTISDVDSPATFVAQTGTVGTYGTFAIDAAGVWTYTASSAHNEFAAGSTYTDSFSVASADGTTTNVTVNIAGTNDAALLSSATVALTEGNTAAAISTGGTLTISDVDSPATFVAQTGTVGTYGTFAIDAAGVWTYTASSAHNEFAAGSTYTDSFSVASADGTTTNVTVNIAGTNDAALLSSATVALTEGNTAAAISTGGTLTISDVDSPATFVAQTGTVGTYGTFAIDAAGVWTYTASSAHNEFAAGSTYTDSFSVASADGTTTNVTVNIAGTNDGPIAVADTTSLSLSSSLTATGNVLANDTDVDTGDTKAVSAVNGVSGNVGSTISGSYGSVQINSNGSYSYTVDNTNPSVIALGATGSLNDTFTYTVRDAAGAISSTTLTVTITGLNQPPTAVADSANTQEDVTTTAAGNVLTNDTDANNDTLAVSAVNGVAGNVNGAVAGTYGSVTIAANGTYTYTLNNAAANVQALAAGQTVTDVFNYTVSDGNGGTSSTSLTVTVTGTNDAPVVTAGGTLAYTENQVATAINGTLTVTDVDSANLTGATVTIGTNFATGQDVLGFTNQSGITGSYNAATGVLTLSGTATVAQYQTALRSVTYSNSSENPTTAARTVNFQVNDGAANSVVASTSVTVAAVNDPPVGNNDTGSGTEAGGTANGTAGTNASGNVLTNDTDPENNTLSVSAIRIGNTEGAGTAGTVGTALVGTYGSLTLNSDGTYSYAINNNNASVQGLNAGGTLTESFNYTLSDGSLTDIAVLTITINGTNDAPVAVADVGAVAEDATLTVTAANGVILGVGADSDVDNTAGTLAVSGAVAGVGAVTQGSGVATSLAGTYGHLTLNANGSYSYIADTANSLAAGVTVTDTFTYTVKDPGNLVSNTATLTITVTGTNDAPVVTAGGTLAYTENQVATAINGTLTVTDVDSANLTGATVTIGTNFATGQDVLGFTNQSGITGSYNAATGVLTLSGTATVAQYQTALRSVTYSNSSENPTTAARTVNFQVNDGAANSVVASTSVTVAAVNDPPVGNNDTGSGTEAGGTANGTAGTNASGNVLTNDTDPENNTLSVSAIRIGNTEGAGTAGTVGTALVGTYGSLTLNSDGTYSYAINNNNASVQGLNAGGTLTESFNYTLSDGSLTDIAVLTITINGTNDAPVAVADVGAVAEDATLTVTAANGVILGVGADSDVDNTAGTLAVSGAVAGVGAVTQGSGVATSLAGTYGHLTLNANGSYSYIADTANSLAAGVTVTDTFTYTVKDPGNLVSNTATLTITVTGTNDAPVVTAGGTLAYTENQVATAINGTLTVTDVDSANLTGATVTIGTNFATGQDVLGFTNQSGITGSYNAATGVLTLSGTATVAQYQTALRSVTYSNSSENPTTAARTVNFQVNDGAANSVVASTSVTVAAVNDPPVGNNDTGSGTEAGGTANGTAGTNASGNVLTNDTDPENNTLSVSAIRIGNTEGAGTAGTVGTALVGTYGSLTLNSDGTYSYAINNNNASVQGLNAGGTLTESFNYTLSDGSLTDIAVLTITINGTNDAPVAVADVGAVAEDATLTVTAANGVILGVGADSDVDNTAGTLAVSGAVAGVGAVTQGSGVATSLAGTYGHLTLNANGSYSYIADTANSLAAGVTVTDTFTYTVKDPGNLVSNTATLTITVTGTNDAPVVTAGGTLAYTENQVATAINGTLTVTDVDSANLTGATVTIGTNFATGQDVLGFTNQSGITGSYNAATGVLTLSGTATVAQYQTALRSVTYSNSSENPTTAARTVNFQVNDGAANSVVASTSVTVAAVNDPPVGNNDTGSGTEAGGTANGTAGTNASGNVLTNDTDPENNTLSVSAIRIGNTEGAGTAGTVGTALVGTYGSLTLNSDGTYSYAINNNNASVQGLNAGGTLTESFNYTLSDGSLTDIAVLTITINGTNDAPVAVADVGAVAEDATLTVTAANGVILGVGADSDVDNTAGTLAVSGAVAGVGAVTQGSGVATSLAGTYGHLTLNANGSYSYIADTANSLAAGVTVTDTFTYTVKDPGNLVSNTATLTITVTGTNDAPVVTAGGTLAYTENQVATAINGTLTVTDVDSANLTGATVTIGTNFATGQDVLGFTNQSGITGSYNAATGVLTLSGTATVAQYQTALRSVTYSNSSENPTTAARTVNFQVNDGAANSVVASTSVTVAAVNDPPVGNNDTGSGTEAGGTANGTAGTNASGNVLTNDTDPENNTLSVSAIRIGNTEGAGTAGTVGTALVGTYGSLTLNSDGTYSYAINNNNASVQGLNAGGTLTESFNYTLSDGSLTDIAVLTITINGTNDAPVVTAGGTLAYTENQAATAINGTLTVTDVDSANLTGATVTIGTNFATGQDVLGFTNQSGITGSYNAATGVLTLSGTATVAQYQTALRSVTYSNTSENPSTAGRTINFVVNDGVDNSNVGSSSVTVVAVNDAPVVTAGGTLAYTENQAATAINGTLTVTDVDSANLTGATVTIGTNFATGQDVLGFTNQSGITGSYNAATGVLTLSGTATVAQYQTALRSVTYSNSSENPTTAARTVNFQVNDGAANSVVASTSVTVAAVNDAPVGNTDNYSSVEGTTTLKATVLTNDTDAESNPLTVSQFATNISGLNTSTANGTNTITTALGGTVVMNANGTYTYTAPVRNHATVDTDGPDIDSFAYKANDGSLNSAWTTVNITVTDTAPTANNDVDSVGIGSSVNGNVITGAGGVTADTLNVDGPFNLTNVVLTTGTQVSNTLNVATNVRTIVTNNGTLAIDLDDGSYNYTAGVTPKTVTNPTGIASFTAQGINLYGFDTAEPYNTAGNVNSGLNLATLDNTSAGRARFQENTGENDDGFGVEQNVDLVTASNTYRTENGEQLVISLGVLSKSTSIALSNLGSGETATWETYNAAGAIVSSGTTAGSGTVGTGTGGQVNISISSGTAFSYVVVRSTANASHFRVDGITVIPEPNAVSDVFTYTLTDSDGDTSNATLTMNYDSTTTTFNDTVSVNEAGINLNGTQNAGTLQEQTIETATGNILANDTGVSSFTQITGITTTSGMTLAGGVADANGVYNFSDSRGTVQIYSQNFNGFVKGDYVINLTGKSTQGTNDSLAFNYQLQNSVSGEADNATLTVSIVDDVPIVENSITEIGALPTTNFQLFFMLDVSGSMTSSAASGDQRLVDDNGNATVVSSTGGANSRFDAAHGTSTLAQMRDAVKALVSQYFDESTNVSVEFGVFSTGAQYNNVSYTTKASALAAIDALTNLTGGTNYSAGLTALQQMIGTVANPNDGVQRVSYFITDGVPGNNTLVGQVNSAGPNITSNDTDPGGATGFTTYASANNIQSYGVAIGAAVPSTTALNTIHNVDADASDVESGAANNGKDNALVVSDLSKLSQTLAATIPPSYGGNIGGTGAAAVRLGADGGYTQYIDVLLDSADAGTAPDTLVRFTYNAATGQITNNNNAIAGTTVTSDTITLNGTKNFTQGTLVFNFVTGDYLYYPQGTVAVGEEINIAFQVVDGDGDTAGGTTTIRIVDGKPIAVNDFDTLTPSTLAAAAKFFDGNVLNAIGTDGGGTQISGFRTGTSGEDQIIDGADVTSIVFKGTTYNLTAASSGAANGGNYTINAQGELTWTSTTEPANVLIFHRDGYYKYTPPAAQTVDLAQAAVVSVDLRNNATDATNKFVSLAGYTKTANLNNAGNAVIGYGTTGAGVTGGTTSGGRQTIDQLENMSITFAAANYARGVQNVTLRFNTADSLLGNNGTGTIGSVQLSIYDIAGNLLGQEVVSDDTVAYTVPGTYANIGSIFIQANSSTGTTAGVAVLQTLTFNPISAPVSTVSAPDEVIQYTITDKDITNPDSSTASLTLHVVTNEFAGTAGADTLTGTASNDLISGLAGDDSINGAAGNDIIRGGAGNDSIDGGADDDQLYGGDGNDSIIGGTGKDYLYGEAGNDTLLGGDGNDTIYGGAGTDSIDGGLGDDLIFGGVGNDTLTGGAGSDTFKWELADRGAKGSPAKDTITDFDVAPATSGGDVLDLRDLLTGENHTIGIGNLDSYLHFEKVGTDTIVHINNVGEFSTGFSATKDVQTITLSGVDLVTGFANDQAIIQDLLTKQKLITD